MRMCLDIVLLCRMGYALVQFTPSTASMTNLQQVSSLLLPTNLSHLEEPKDVTPCFLQASILMYLFTCDLSNTCSLPFIRKPHLRDTTVYPKQSAIKPPL